MGASMVRNWLPVLCRSFSRGNTAEATWVGTLILALAWLAWLALPWLGLARLGLALAWPGLGNSKNNNPPAFGGRAALRAAVVVFAVENDKPS